MNVPQNMTLDQTMETSRIQNVDTLQQACRFLDKCLLRDNTAPTLQDQLSSTGLQVGNTQQQLVASASGLSDHDYPVLQGLPLSIATKTQIKTLNRVPLPPEITENFNHIQCHCMMGLFPEINRAWLTIDSDIYLWTYEEGGDVAYFDGLNETILSVGLVRPKQGVFQNYVRHLLVLATTVDIVVLGVSFTSEEDDPFKEIHLFCDPVFTIPTDAVAITTIVGNECGRIFYGGKDGSLYEISYQAESSWFGKRCKKINHSTSKLAYLVPSFAYAAMTSEDPIAQISIDDTRNILYVLTEKGTVEAYDMGENGTSLSKVGRLMQSNLVHQAHNTVRTLDSQNFLPVISISAVELTESTRINLVAVTQSGVRYYFTTYTASQISMPNPRPTTLALMHVRLPPGISATAHFRPRAIHMANYRDRSTVMISCVNEQETLWCIGSDLFPFAPTLMEATTTIDVDGPVLALAEVKYDTNILLQPTQQLPPLIVRQHSEAPRKYVVLTAQGAHIFIKQRPVDLLKQLLVESRGQDTNVLKSFFAIQQEDQACATSLILASLESPQNAEVSEYATNAFFVLGGEPQLSPLYANQNVNANINSSFNQTQYGSPSFMPNMVSTPVSNVQQQQMQQQQTMSPRFQSNQIYNSTFYTPPQHLSPQPFVPQNPMVVNALFESNCPFQYSSKHNGLYYYVGRILRPIWNLRCVEKMTLDGKKFYLTSSISSDDCAWILCHLNALCQFFQKNTQLSICNAKESMQQSRNAPASNTELFRPSVNSRSRLTQQDAQLEERQSLESLKLFVQHSAQVLGLWRILTQHQFHLLMESLPQNHQQLLQNTTFKEIFLFGHEVCLNLINSLINSYLGDNASVDSISAKLRDVCPSLYKLEDAACSKANEVLKKAKQVTNFDEKEELLSQALTLCKSVAPNVNLSEICTQFTNLKSYQAVIDLCVTCAKKLDPEDVAVHFYKNSDQNDQDAYQYYSRRMEVYKEVVNMLETVYGQNDGTQSVANISGQQEELMPSSNITRQIVLNALKYSDELLHIAIYEWMMSRRMQTDLIAITEPTLETFLVKASVHNPNNVQVLEILWKYYESHNNHAQAARILDSLASLEDPSLKLRDRMSYLARALMCMRSDRIGYAPYLGEYLKQLEDKIAVAKVQELILDAVVKLKDTHPEAESAEQILNMKLFDVSALYEDFADKFLLWECKLAIMDCAGESNRLMVENIWQNILHNEVIKARTHSANDALIQIIGKVRSLVRIYKSSHGCVPLGFLIREMEKISAKFKADRSLVPNFFVNMEYPIDTLINTYNEVMLGSNKDNFWTAEDHESHFSEAMAALIHAFISSHEKYTNVEKRKLISLSMDTVAGLLSSLYSKANTQHIVTLLRSIQAKLSRM